jgi:uncharacterized membrane protein
MGHFSRIFVRGFVTLLPIAVTIYILYSAIIILENVLGSLIRIILPKGAYVPGLGFVVTLVTIYLFGLLLNSYLAEGFLKSIEARIREVPFIKAIYSPLKDLMNLFTRDKHDQMKNVVLVKLPDNRYALGVVTRENFDDIKLSTGSGNINQHKNTVAVFFPMSYGLGGFTFLVPHEQLETIDIPVEKAMSLAITGWVKKSED